MKVEREREREREREIQIIATKSHLHLKLFKTKVSLSTPKLNHFKERAIESSIILKKFEFQPIQRDNITTTTISSSNHAFSSYTFLDTIDQISSHYAENELSKISTFKSTPLGKRLFPLSQLFLCSFLPFLYKKKVNKKQE